MIKLIEKIRKIICNTLCSTSAFSQRINELENDLALAKVRIRELKALVDELLAKILDGYDGFIGADFPQRYG
jgi:hypothetical protein